MMRGRSSLPGLAWLILPFAACTPDFDPQSLVLEPRVIGIRADPPEVDFQQETQGTVTLTALLAEPDEPPDGAPGPWEVREMRWTVCPLNLGAQAAYRCAIDETPVEGDPATRSAFFDGALLWVALDLIRPITPEVLEFLKQTVKQSDACLLDLLRTWDDCRKAQGDETPCVDPAFEGLRTCLVEAGQDVTFHLQVTWQNGRDSRTQDAYKRVFFRRITPENPANRNPAFSLWLEPEEGADLERITATGDPAEARVLGCPGQDLRLEPRFRPGSRESRPSGTGGLEDEYWFFSWLTTRGTFDRIKSSTATVSPSDPLQLGNVLSLPEADEFPDSFPVWVVARDDRLGMDFVTFRVERRPGDRCLPPEGAPKDWRPPPPEVRPGDGGQETGGAP